MDGSISKDIQYILSIQTLMFRYFVEIIFLHVKLNLKYIYLPLERFEL